MPVTGPFEIDTFMLRRYLMPSAGSAEIVREQNRWYRRIRQCDMLPWRVSLSRPREPTEGPGHPISTILATDGGT